MSVETLSNLPQAALHYQDGRSDKVYQIAVEPAGPAGYAVNFAFGRRGGALQTGSKTPAPVPLPEAMRIYNRIITEKRAKGYADAAGGAFQPQQSAEPSTEAPAAEPAAAPTVSGGPLPQLLNPIDEATALGLIGDNRWCLQEKHDGKRVLLTIDIGAGMVQGTNRRGLPCSIPQVIVDAARKLSTGGIIDGELVGDTFYAFDLLSLRGQSIRQVRYIDRYMRLQTLLGSHRGPLFISETYMGQLGKSQALARLRKAKAEGVVFKQNDAPHTAGRPSKLGPQLKLKFTATASVIVAGITPGKRSIEMALLEAGQQTEVGRCTIPPNATIPKPGSIVEVQYLYAYPGGSLFQPVYLGERDDVSIADCSISQLKYKADAEEESEA
jgi:bifunctional non-homologous end joining protein LigD